MTDQPNYIKRVFTMPLRPGQVTTVIVRHDDDCPRLHGGECRCDAVIEPMNRWERRVQRKKRGKK